MQIRLLTAALVVASSLTLAGAVSAQPAPPTDGARSGPATGGGKHAHAQDRRGHRGHGGIDRLARFDTDGDGRISRAEAEAATVAMQARRDAARAGRDRPQRPQATGAASRGDDARARRPHRGGLDLVAEFDAIDANRDGYLTRAELRDWQARKIAAHRAERERRFEARFRAADLNGDGRLSRVEVSEAMPRLADRFAWLDENGDGFLDRDELRAARTTR